MAMDYMIWQAMFGNGAPIGTEMIIMLPKLLIKFGLIRKAQRTVMIPVNLVFLKKYKGGARFYAPINIAPDTWLVQEEKLIGEPLPIMQDSDA